uniref:Ig-like domain-containing protein n=1 Tax=Knipowitschia caucasica TaxID=637954 RepID=A0AAV2LK84_KNICA
MGLYYIALCLAYVLVQCDGDVRVNLTAVVGRSVTFPDSIHEDIYTNRLHWNKSTGLFTLSDLQKKDSGVYSIDSKKGNVFFKYYDLKVFEEVSGPVVSCVNVSSDSVTLQCSVKHTEQTTLSWFRGGQSVVSSSSAVLPLTVQQGNYTDQYKCVSQNPVDNKTATVNITAVCTGKNESNQSDEKKRSVIIIPIVSGVLVFIIIIILCIVFFIKKKFSKPESPSLQSQDSVQYAQIDHLKKRDTQSANSSPPSANILQRPLDTVYDQIQPH